MRNEEKKESAATRMSDSEFEVFCERLKLHANRYLSFTLEARRARGRERELERRLGEIRQLATAYEVTETERIVANQEEFYHDPLSFAAKRAREARQAEAKALHALLVACGAGKAA